MANVFISYAREDLNFAEKLANRLSRTGLTIWWDRRLLAGDDIEAVIDEQIKSCDAVIVVWSSASLNSHWVKSEASAALALKKLVPVRSDGTRLPRPYDQIHTLDLSNWKGGFNKDIRLLFDSISTISKGKKIRRGPGKAAGTISKRRIFSIGAIASAAVVGLAVVSDLTDLIGNLSGQNNEKSLADKIEQLDDRLARMDAPKTAAIDEIYLRESLRALQTFDIPVDDLVVEMAAQPNFNAIVGALEETLNTKANSLAPQRKRVLLHQLAALLYQTDRAKAETLYQTILDSHPDDFAANLLMSDIYANKHEPKTSAEFVTAAKKVTPPNRSSELTLEIARAFNMGLEQEYQAAADLLHDIQHQATLEGLDYQKSAAVNIRGMLLIILEQNDEARRTLEEIISLQRMQSYYSHLAGSLFSLAEIERQDTNTQAAMDYLNEYLSIAEALQRPGYLAQGYQMLGRLELEADNLDAAELHFTRGLAIGREHKFSGDIIRNAIGLADISLARDNIPSACRYYNVAETETLNVGSRSFAEVAEKKENLCGPI